MYNGNNTNMELYLSAEPELKNLQPGDKVCKCNAAMFQGKKEEGKKPMWVTIEAWKYLAECLAGLKKGDTVIIGGSLKMNYWGDQDEHSRLILSADSIAKKVWAPRNQQQQSPQQPQGYTPETNYQQQQNVQPVQQTPAQQQFGGQPQQMPDDDIQF